MAKINAQMLPLCAWITLCVHVVGTHDGVQRFVPAMV